MDRRQVRRERRSDARGLLLMELAVSLPVFVLLLSFLAFALVWSWRSYQRSIADAELRQEMQLAAVRVVESALLSDHIREQMTGVYEMRQAVRRRNQSERPLDRYWLRDGRIVFNYGSFPITGSFAGAGVHISSFSIIPDADHPRLYHIEMTGRSVASGRTHRIATEVYLREDMGDD
ncbi:prepilin-type cleavage/methylation protein [uncultured Selenomonas sp.]|uniref:prepilin-type cleavage/methylation protein n=1 Tax=uncultured Selenomonas sp. TaxID=159275 RepID=UPI0028D57230|nr:prepilin-type cleavage/methylation protein [uncultured Selenomonas sp.]